MNINKKIFWSEMYYQPKLTYILKNLDTSSFDELGKIFEKILGYAIQVHVSKSEIEKWTVYFNGHGRESSIRLILYLFDPSSGRFGSANLDIEKPTVEIVDFIMNPKGQGLGREVIRGLIRFIEASQWGFEIMMLKAQDRRAASFWEKVGFKEVEGSFSHMPSMILPLVKSIRENKVTIKVKVHPSSKKEKVILDEYNI